MSEAVLERVRELLESVERNTPVVEERVARSGLNVDPRLKLALAKYWDALEKLSTE